MNINSTFQGLWPALFTPVGKDERPDFEQLNKLCNLLVDQGVDGLYVLGSTGQGVLFSESDRRAVLEAVIKSVQGKLPVMVQVGSLTTKESVRLAEHAAASGASALSSVGPIYFGGAQKAALLHYEAIARAGQLPFFPYQLGDNSIPGSFYDFVQQVLDIPHIAGMKLTTSNLLEISRINNFSKGRLQLFSGADELMCQAALSGTVGAIGTFYNLWGAECKYVLEKFKQGDFELARSFMLKFQQIIDHVLPNIWTFLREAMLQRYQIDIGVTVAPLARGQEAWSPEEVNSILNAMDIKNKE